LQSISVIPNSQQGLHAEMDVISTLTFAMNWKAIMTLALLFVTPRM
jgi:hypothetical protein